MSIEYAEWIKQASTEAHSLAREHLQTSAKRQKKYYDKNSATAGFKTGVWVWHYYPPKAKQKLGRPWRGPYLIVGKPSDVTVQIQKGPGDKVISVHVDNLKVYRGDTAPESWVTGQRMSEDNTQELPTSDSHSYPNSEVSPVASLIPPDSHPTMNIDVFEEPTERSETSDLETQRRGKLNRKPPDRLDFRAWHICFQ